MIRAVVDTSIVVRAILKPLWDPRTVVDLMLLRGEAVEPRIELKACRDPKDDKFLDVAVEGRADALVSGDQDLLILHPFQGIPIIEPAEFPAMLA